MKFLRHSILIGALWALLSTPALSQEVSYSKDILHILANKCFACHGPDPEARKADLRLDQFDSATEERNFEPAAIVPGNWAESVLAARVNSADPDEQMPPPESGKHLSEEEIRLLREWIERGAKYEAHWSYGAPKRAALPAVSDTEWPRSDLDRFVLARLDREGLTPSPGADKYTLIRRVYLDLIGLPPTPEEADAFVADASPRAYEKVVGRLMASPRFGEQWARGWLDLARYADTKGYEQDQRRTIWPYRDWVIDAFNRDLPFDLFTIEQIAGDLLPSPRQDQLIATAFHRNTMTNDEGGTDDEEFRVAAVVDRVNTTMAVWMGTTMACAQCHDHKYDPFSQKEYYQLYDFFNHTADNDQESERPTLALPTSEQSAAKARLTDAVAEGDTLLDESMESRSEAQAAWEREAADNEALETAFVGVNRVREALGTPEADRTEEHARVLRLAFYESDPELKTMYEALQEQRDELGAVKGAITKLPIFRRVDAGEERETHVQIRGSFLNPGEAVEADVPGILHPLESGDGPQDRLAFANWLVDRDNPLTARVIVNRAWEQIFGAGIVETTQGFGTRGTLPSHPELLDWLALEFMDNRWSFKALCRTIVESSTYRQSSAVTKRFLKRDPYNRLLARGPRFRLDAEMIRDQALAVSGLLSDTMHGPSVMPPQPKDVWQVVYNGDQWLTSAGDDRYRRGLYTFWRRTSPYPSMVTFDAGSREVCTVRRSRTNTPLQALVTLNDPVYVEAAQALARRMAEDADASIDERVELGFRRVLVRPPTKPERKRLVRAYDVEYAHYQTRLDEAKRLATDPLGDIEGADYASLAAWTVVANVLLNLDETVTTR